MLGCQLSACRCVFALLCSIFDANFTRHTPIYAPWPSCQGRPHAPSPLEGAGLDGAWKSQDQSVPPPNASSTFSTDDNDWILHDDKWQQGKKKKTAGVRVFVC